MGQVSWQVGRCPALNPRRRGLGTPSASGVTQGARGKQPGPRVATDKGGGALCACTAGSGASLGFAARAQRVRVTPEGACAVSPARRQDAARRAAGKQLPDR